MPESSACMSQHSSGSASQFSSFLSGCHTSASPQSHDGNMDGQIITLFGHLNIYLPEGTGRICSRARSPAKLSRTQTQDPVSNMLWPLRDQRLSKLPEEIQRNTQGPSEAPREHDSFGLRFKVKGEQLWDVWLNPCGFGVILWLYRFSHCKSIWEGGCLTHRQISVLKGRPLVFWASLLNELVNFHWQLFNLAYSNHFLKGNFYKRDKVK